MAVKSRREILANAFQPGRELDDPKLFSGRRAQVSQITDALHTSVSCPIIFGDRGLGKSSLALQARQIAWGRHDLLYSLGLEDRFIDPSNAYVCFLVTCSDATSTTSDLLKRISRSMTSVMATSLKGDKSKKEQLLVDRTTKTAVSVKLFTREVVKKYKAAVEDVGNATGDPEEEVQQLAQAVYETTGHRVLIVIDELDRLRDANGLASFIKNASSDALKFILVGIAQDVSSLIQDHASVERIAHPIEVKRMKEDELKGIVDKAVDRLLSEGVAISFDATARTALARVAQGFPWFVHVIGQASLFAADDDGSLHVRAETVRQAAQDLVNNRFAQRFSDLYQMAVRDSLHRELVLRMFARWSGRDIPTADIYRALKNDLGVSNPSVYKGQLTSEKYGRVLQTPPFQQTGLVRFSNEMFKAYVRIRPALFTGAEDDVERAWKASR